MLISWFSEQSLCALLAQETARRIAQVSRDSKIDLDEDDYLDSFKPHMMKIVFAWASGSSFKQVCSIHVLVKYRTIQFYCYSVCTELLYEYTTGFFYRYCTHTRICIKAKIRTSTVETRKMRWLIPENFVIASSLCSL